MTWRDLSNRRQFPAADGSVDRSSCRPIFVARREDGQMTSKTPSPGSSMLNAQNRSESARMMHSRNNRLSSRPRTSHLFFGRNRREPSKIRILAIGSRDA